MAKNLALIARDAMVDFRAKLRRGDTHTVAVMTTAVLCILPSLDITQLVLALLGAAAYALAQPLSVPSARRSQKSMPKVPPPPAVKTSGYALPVERAPRVGGVASPAAKSPAPLQAPRAPRPAPGNAAAAPALSPSVRPIAAPMFKAAGWDAQVHELVESLVPSLAADRGVERLARRVQCLLREAAPEAEVVGFAGGAMLRGRAFGVAVPDVDLVVTCGPAALSARLFAGRGKSSPGQRLEGRQLQKAALRSFTDRLVASGGFKFRRSAFSAEEPKVTLMAAGFSGGNRETAADAVPFDLAINSPTPLHNAALTAECGRLDVRARALVLLVRRWARDRGICHAAKGHLPPYCWTLLAIYFLQVGSEDGQQVLPPLEGSKALSRLDATRRTGPSPPAAGAEPQSSSGEAAAPSASAKSVGALFREFVDFYRGRFDARQEAVSVRLGRRAQPSPRLPLHLVPHADGSGSDVAPSIEDPFEETRNLAGGMTSLGLARLREELDRAAALLAAGEEASLSQLLEPWVPEETGTVKEEEGEEEA